jgi:hypothetical protein
MGEQDKQDSAEQKPLAIQGLASENHRAATAEWQGYAPEILAALLDP